MQNPASGDGESYAIVMRTDTMTGKILALGEKRYARVDDETEERFASFDEAVAFCRSEVERDWEVGFVIENAQGISIEICPARESIPTARPRESLAKRAWRFLFGR